MGLQGFPKGLLQFTHQGGEGLRGCPIPRFAGTSPLRWGSISAPRSSKSLPIAMGRWPEGPVGHPDHRNKRLFCDWIEFFMSHYSPQGGTGRKITASSCAQALPLASLGVAFLRGGESERKFSVSDRAVLYLQHACDALRTVVY